MSALSQLIRLRLSRDRVSMFVWATVFFIMWGPIAKGIGAAYDEAGLRELAVLIAGNPATRFMRGAPAGGTLEAIMFVSLFGYLVLAIGIMGALIGLRHLRAEEEQGRAELIMAGAVERKAPLMATVIVGLLETGLVSIAFVLSSTTVAGFDFVGSFVTAFALFATGVAGLFIGLLAGQLAPTSRAATFGAIGVMLAFYLVRGIGEAQGELQDDPAFVEPGALTWFSPMGWGVLARPFASEPWSPNPTPLMLFMPLLALLAVAVELIEMNRELGASVFSSGHGRATAAAGLGGPASLSLRTRTITIIGYALGGAVLGLAAGVIAPMFESLADQAPEFQQVWDRITGGAGARPELLVVIAMAGFIALLAAAAATQLTLSTHADERDFGEAFGSAALSRTRWLLGNTAVGLFAGMLVLAAFYLVTCTALAIQDVDAWADAARITFAYAPVVALFAALAALLIAFVPRMSGFIWLLLFGSLIFGEFAPMFAPDAEGLEKLSPFAWIGNPMLPEFDPWVMLWFGLISLGICILALIGWRRRDLQPQH